MENYKIFYPKDRQSFAVRIEELEATVGEYINEEKQNGRRIVYSKVFLSDIRNQNSMFCESALHTRPSSPFASAQSLWGYKFGYELLMLNGMLTFAGLWMSGWLRR